MSRTVRLLLLALALASLAAYAVIRSGILEPPPAPVVVTPEAIARGRLVYRNRCHGCHNDIPLEKRVAGWSADQAYAVIGDLPKRKRAMPAFAGDDAERRALAAWVHALGAGQVPQY
jgi:mono/diheme cytochrome c family protein